MHRALLTLALVATVSPASANAGQHWSKPQRLSATATDFAIDADASGGAVAAWVEHERGGGATVWTARRAPGKRFGPPRVLTDPAKVAGAPHVDMNAGGDALVGWVEQVDAGPDRMWTIFEPASGPPEAPQSITTASDDISVYAGFQLALQPNRTALAIWARPEKAGYSTVRTSRAADKGPWEAPRDLGTATYDTGVLPLAAAGGRAVAAWDRSGEPFSSGPAQDVFTEAIGDQGFRDPAAVEPTALKPTALAVDDAGSAAMLLTAGDFADSTAVQLSRARSGSAFGKPITIGRADNNLDYAGGVALSAGNTGDLAASWIRTSHKRTFVDVLPSRAHTRLRRTSSYSIRPRAGETLSGPVAAWAGRDLLSVWLHESPDGFTRVNVATGGGRRFSKPRTLGSGFSSQYMPVTPSRNVVLLADRRGHAVVAWRLGDVLEVSSR